LDLFHAIDIHNFHEAQHGKYYRVTCTIAGIVTKSA